MTKKQKNTRFFFDSLRVAITCLSTLFCVVILLGIILYVFIQGSSRLSLKLITSDYEEEMVTLKIEGSSSFFDDPNLDGVYFSSNYGIGLKDSLTTDGEHCVIVSYIDSQSPFNNAISNRTDEKVTVEIGNRLTVFTGLNENDDVIYTKNSDTAKEFVEIMDQTIIITSVQCKVGGGGIRGSLITTLLLIVVTLVIALPLGVGAAIYLVEYAKEGRIKRIIQTMIDMTSGIPSIIFGFCGSLIFIPFVSTVFNAPGYTILAGAFTMALVLLPTVIKTTSESLMLIPKSFTMASLALGASKTQTIFKVILPSALPGILTAILLSIGRIIGESAALIFVMGTSISDNVGLLNSSTSLSLHIWSIVGGENPNYQTACAISIIILLVVFILSILVKIVSKRINKMAV